MNLFEGKLNNKKELEIHIVIERKDEKSFSIRIKSFIEVNV